MARATGKATLSASPAPGGNPRLEGRSFLRLLRWAMPTSRDEPLGCDTLVATATGTADRSVIFAKKSDRHPDEGQPLRVYPGRDWDRGATVRCQYVSVPQVRHPYRVLGSQPF